MLSSHDADQERLKAIAENAYRLSPVNDLVRRAVPMNLEIEVDQVLSLFPEIMIASLYRLRDKGIG